MKSHVLAIAIIAASCALVACQEDAGAPAADAASPGADADTPADAADAPTALADAFDANDEAARPLDAAAVVAVDAPLHCSVDSINETPASDGITLPRSERVRFSGFIQGASLEEPSILVLRGDDATYFVNNVPTMERADIAEHKGIQDSSAFDYSTFATLDAVQPGSYSVELLANDGDAIRRCASSVTVVVE